MTATAVAALAVSATHVASSTPAATAGPLSTWSLLMVVAWMAVVGVVWLLLIAHGRAAPD